jgi:YHS domain-containing protein
MKNINDGLKERICPICGKRFYVHEVASHIYKKQEQGKTQIFCSWGCMRTYEKRGKK